MEFELTLINCRSKQNKSEPQLLKSQLDHATSVATEASRVFIGMLLDADTSIYRKITEFNEELLKYLPDTAQERHAHHYFCITKKDYVRGNEFCRKNFSNPHYDWANPNSVVAVTQVNCDTFNFKMEDNNSIHLYYGEKNLNCLSDYLLKYKNIEYIYLIGNWDTTNMNKLKRSYFENIKICYIVEARDGSGTRPPEQKRTQALQFALSNLIGLNKVEIINIKF